MRAVRIGLPCLAAAAAAIAVAGWFPRTVHAQIRASSIQAMDAAAIRQWDSTIDRMVRSGELRVRRTDEDTLVAGRTHERLSQVDNKSCGNKNLQWLPECG